MLTARLTATLTAGLTTGILAGCARVDSGAAPAPASQAPRAPAPFRVPADSTIPDGPLGAAIRRGRALLDATGDSLPPHVGNGLRCTSCHLDRGRRVHAMPWVGVYARFPQYRSRNDAVITLADRINDCFARSLNGHGLPADGREMRDMVTYMAFLSRGYAVGGTVAGQGLPAMTPLTPDTTRGRRVFATTCVACHGTDGGGTPAAPPLWGPRSYNIGAGMARLRTAAAFIRYNMPAGNPHLTDQQAFDVAAYVDSRTRPDFAGKENDWPRGDAPPDVAYPTTAGRAAASVWGPARSPLGR